MAGKHKKYIQTSLKFGVTAVALYFVFRKIDFSQILDLYRTASIKYLIAALLLFAGSKALSSFRLNLLFHRTGIPLSSVTNLKLYLIGMFYNLFLPGGIGGDGYKIYLLNRHYDVRARKILGAVFMDRVTGIVMLWVIALCFLYFVEPHIPYRYLIFIAIPILFAGLYLGMHWLFREYVAVYLPICVYSIGVQLMQVLCAYCILMAFHHDDGNFSYLFLFLISSIVTIIPITVGGAGMREITFLYGAQFLGVDTHLSVALSLMFYFITVIVSFFGIYFVIKPIKFGESAFHL
ncbi:MAG: lysylphosphatidylglycerol synthase transmembrane domain-containing protein [Bacteroidales bacterium]|nr:flippase-like domain-containing protein [Lentimicrobiaceae bacterium]MDD5695469.1 lysylphosphatidylglycerol synthase transmembrane domain-containing protein [Bacteroidales bacterium]